MRHIIADHSCNAFLKPGEVIISSNPVLVSTVLGSCVAVTMYSPEKRVGAICHAMLPNNLKHRDNLLYVESAVRCIHCKMIEYGGEGDLVIKLFGGAQVLAGCHSTGTRRSVGEQNIAQARKILGQLGLAIATEDVGGNSGRKLLFSIKTGDVYLRKLKLGGIDCAYPQGVMQ
jgi:chemotaxis protein CheD